jgi:hypothetical protein
VPSTEDPALQAPVGEARGNGAIKPEYECMWVNVPPGGSGVGTSDNVSPEAMAGGPSGIGSGEDTTKKSCFVDRGVYSRNRAFRLLLSSKFNKTSVLVVARTQVRSAAGAAAGSADSLDRINARLAMSQVPTSSRSSNGRSRAVGSSLGRKAVSGPKSPPLKDLYAHMLRQTYVVPFPTAQWTAFGLKGPDDPIYSPAGTARKRQSLVGSTSPSVHTNGNASSARVSSSALFQSPAAATCVDPGVDAAGAAASSDLLVMPEEFCHGLQAEGRHYLPLPLLDGAPSSASYVPQPFKSLSGGAGGVAGMLCSSMNCLQTHTFSAALAATASGRNLLDRQYFFTAADKEGTRHGYGCLTGYLQYMQCPPSHFPRLDEFIVGYAKKGGVQGSIKSWTFSYSGSLPTPGDSNAEALVSDSVPVRVAAPYTFKMRYQIVNNRFCENVRRAHKSNHIGYEVNLNRGTLQQYCWDPDCSGFKSNPVALPESSLPPEITFLHPLSFELQCLHCLCSHE